MSAFTPTESGRVS